MNGVNSKSLSEFTTELYRRGVEFICIAGDLVSGYTSNERDFESQLETWKQIVQPIAAHIPFYKGMGNHEQLGDYYKVPDPKEEGSFMLLFTDKKGEKSAEACFAREFVNPKGSVYGFDAPSPETHVAGLGGTETGPTYTENVYSFNYGNAHFVILNNNYWYTGLKDAGGFSREFADKEANVIALKHLGGNREGYIRENQLEWLERDIQETQDDSNIDLAFIFFHEPVFPNGGHISDAMYWGIKGKEELGGLSDANAPLGDVIDMRNRFLKILAKYSKVVAIMCGHEHSYSRMCIDSSLYLDYQRPVWQIISGGCGAPFYAQNKSVPWVGKVESFSSSNHCCLFAVEGKHVTLTVCSDTGQIIDHIEDLNTVK
jgi:hypothetical protein